jgi:hypothetical protein
MKRIHASLRSADPSVSVAVTPTMPTLFLLIGDLLVRNDTLTWLGLWPHEFDPMERFVASLPHTTEAPSWRIVQRLLADGSPDEGDWPDLCRLSRELYLQLSETEQGIVREMNEFDEPGVERVEIRTANGSTVTSEHIYRGLPPRFELAFVQSGVLTFSDNPFQLIAIECSLSQPFR